MDRLLACVGCVARSAPRRPTRTSLSRWNLSSIPAPSRMHLTLGATPSASIWSSTPLAASYSPRIACPFATDAYVTTVGARPASRAACSAPAASATRPATANASTRAEWARMSAVTFGARRISAISVAARSGSPARAKPAMALVYEHASGSMPQPRMRWIHAAARSGWPALACAAMRALKERRSGRCSPSPTIMRSVSITSCGSPAAPYAAIARLYSERRGGAFERRSSS
mmetsp:Transcript_5021/g.16330  ORF Transcript_5021/g.16330 Transcript_5021/m.16330 type:complete len:230 (-) Transcript_5021:494-1183(-)